MSARRTFMPLLLAPLTLALGACGGDAETQEATGDSARDAQVVSMAPDYDAEQATSYLHRQRMAIDDVVTANDMLVQEEYVRVEITRAFTLTTKEIARNGSALIELTWDRIAMNLQRSNLPTFEFDSDEPVPLENQRPLDRILSRVFQTTVSYTMRPNGEIGALRGVPTAESLEVATSLERNLLSFFSESWFRSISDEIWDVGGEANGRALDEEWLKESATQVEHGEKTVVAHKLTGLQRDGELAVIEGAGVMVPEGEQPAKIEDAEVLDQDLYFRLEWSPPLGRTVGYESRQLLKLQTGGRGGRLTRELIVELKLERIGPENERETAPASEG